MFIYLVDLNKGPKKLLNTPKRISIPKESNLKLKIVQN